MSSLARTSDRALPGGKVWLVGAGPGDPELLTVKAARLIALADVIVHDHLVGEDILAQAGSNTRLIYVGKESARHTLPQQEINRLLVSLAGEELAVVRLKGGDPFIFGRGGEELETLRAAGIPFEVVPGITAAAGCAAYSGFPLTHRDHAHALVFVAGHLKDECNCLDWAALASPRQTLVFYMGVGHAAEIACQLIAHGLSADTPVAVVRQATLKTQRTFLTTLVELPERIREADIAPPALIVVGTVVLLRDALSWFEDGAGAVATL